MATITSLSFAITSTYSGAGMRRARRDIDDLDNGLNGMNKAASNIGKQLTSLTNIILGLGPALVPIAIAATGVAGGLTAATAAAGLAAGIFGGALFGAIKATNSATGAAQKALDRQKDSLAGLTPGTKAYEEQLKKVHAAEKNLKTIIDGLTPSQQKYVKATASMKGAWGEFIQATEKDTLTPVSIVFNAIARNIGKLTPVVKAVSPLITRLAKDFAAWMDGPGLTRFIDTMLKQGVPALDSFLKSAQSMLGFLGKGFRDFLPYGNQLFDSMAAGADRLKQWGQGGGFTRFLDKVHEVGPDVKEFFAALTKALTNIAKAASDLSGDSFSVLTTLLKVLASLPPELLANLVRAWMLWNSALLVYNVVAGIAAVVTTALAIATSPFLLLMAGAALTIGAVILALAALAVGIYFLVKNWDTVLAALKTAWNATWNAVKTTAQTVWNFITHGWGQLLLALMGPIGVLIFIYTHWTEIWNGIKTAAFIVWDALKVGWAAFTGWLSSTWNMLWGGLVTGWNAFIAPFMEMWNTVWPQIQLSAQNVWNFLSAAWALLWSGVTIVWNAFWAAFGPVFITAWTSLVNSATAVWDLLKAAWQLVWTVIVSAYQVGWAILSGAWQIGWAWLTGAAQIAWSILTGAWSVVWTTVTGIWNVFYATFSAIFSGAWNVIIAIVTGIWNVIKAAWSALWAVVTAIFLTFTAIFTGNWGQAWNAIKDAVAAIWNVMKTAWQAFLNYLITVFNAFVGVFTAAFRAVWTAIQAIAAAAWAAMRTTFQAFLTALQNLWNAAWTAIRTIFQTITAAIANIASAAWNVLRSGMQAFITTVTGIWNTGWTAIRTLFQTAVNGIVTAATVFWTAIRTAFSAGSTWLRNTFWDPVSNFFTKTIPGAFEAGSKALGKAWDGIKKLVRAPIQAVVDVVYNGGIVKLWNAVAGVFGAKDLKEFKLPAFKEGGPTGSGSASGFAALVHPGEHVWTKQEVRGAGGHGAVAALRSQAMGGAKVRVMGGGRDHAFKDGGGILGSGWGPDSGPDLVPDGIISNVGSAIGSAVSKLKDLALGAISGPFGAAVDAMVKGAQAVIRKLVPGSGTGIEELAVAIPKKIGDIAKSWVSDNDVAESGGGGFVPWAKWKDGDGTKQTYKGVVVNRRTAAMLAHASKVANTAFTMLQGSYSNSVGASAGTHSGGGAVDLGPAKDAIVGAMRESGFAAWRRTPAEGFSPHIHGIAVGDPTASSAAKQQVKAFQAGRNGLADNGPDTYKGGATSGKSVSAAKATGKSLNAGRGWSSHWSALEALWNRESGWRWNADNPSSDAYGIPQALPGSKMKSSGADWKTNPATQIKWGLGYIKSRYGNPSKANSFQKKNNWYADGTYSAFPGWGVVGDGGEPELMRMRGGEQIHPLSDLVGNGGGGTTVEVNAPITIQGNATPGTVDKLQREMVPKLTMAIRQGVGRRP